MSTILSTSNPELELGSRNNFSPIDIAQLNALYDCSSRYFFFGIVRNRIK